MFVCLLDDLILGFCYSNLTRETGGFEVASAITHVLQVILLTKCASQRASTVHILNFSKAIFSVTSAESLPLPAAMLLKNSLGFTQRTV